MPLVDSHAHLDMYPADELRGVLERACAAGVHQILAIGIGDGPREMHRALEIATADHGPGTPAIYATAGIHPQEAAKATGEALTRLRALVEHPRCVAVGEIGLDYYHVENPLPSIQHSALMAQLDIAAAARKPVILHCRTSELATSAAKEKFGAADAWEDLLTLLNEHWNLAVRGMTPAGIMHCFSGSMEHAERSLELGFHLSFAGNLTYPAARVIREVAAAATAGRILVETDAPFLAPIPHRGQRNEPALVTHTAALLAKIRGISEAELAALTTGNFHALFPATLD